MILRLFNYLGKNRNQTCVIRGVLNGDIISAGDVLVADTGVCRGRIKATAIEIAGEFKGSVEATKVVVRRGGRVRFSEAIYQRLVLDEGGVFAPWQRTVESKAEVALIQSGGSKVEEVQVQPEKEDSPRLKHTVTTGDVLPFVAKGFEDASKMEDVSLRQDEAAASSLQKVPEENKDVIIGKVQFYNSF
jgi:cytoskeletal protein CcmA (bactofilin family)